MIDVYLFTSKIKVSIINHIAYLGRINIFTLDYGLLQGGSNMIGTDCV
jgi:hypothetical protein